MEDQLEVAKTDLTYLQDLFKGIREAATTSPTTIIPMVFQAINGMIEEHTEDFCTIQSFSHHF